MVSSHELLLPGQRPQACPPGQPRPPQPAQPDPNRPTVPAEETFGPDARYGLGLVSRPLPCGGLSWSHGGSFPGYETRGGATDDGREANIAVSMQVVDDATRRKLEHAVDIALCR